MLLALRETDSAMIQRKMLNKHIEHKILRCAINALFLTRKIEIVGKHCTIRRND